MARAKFADDEVVVCFEPFHSGHVDGPNVCAPGTRLRGDHPYVRNSPQYFVRDGTPADEVARLRVALIQEAEKDVPQHRAADPEKPTEIAKPLRDEDALVCIAGAAAGERVHRHSLAAETRPELYQAIVPPGLARADALVAKETMRMLGEEGKPIRTLYAGQWCDRHDEFVRLHPQMFVMPYIEES
jgi:hypothetical protein